MSTSARASLSSGQAEPTASTPGGPSTWGLPVVLTIAIAVHLPYALRGPRFLLDDYYTLWFRQTRGLLGTAGPGQLAARPGAWLSYLVEFGLIGRHPLAGYAVLSILDVAAACLLYRCLSRFVPQSWALATTLLWVVIPNHGSLDHWLSTVNIVLGLCLLLAGIDRLAAAVSSHRPPLAAVAFLVASGLCYEAALPVGAAALITVPLLLHQRARIRPTLVAALAIGGTGVWMIAHTKHDLHGGTFDYRSLPTSLFGSGVSNATALADGLLVFALLIVAGSLARLGIRSAWRRSVDGAWLVLAGGALIALGTVAFARDPISPIGLGDRVNQIAAIGAALVWVGGTFQFSRWRRAPSVAIGALVVIGLVGHLASDADYAAAGADNSRIFHVVLQSHPRPIPGVIVVGPTYLSHHGITGMIGPERQAFEVVTSQQGWDVWVATSAADFAAVPAASRVVVLPTRP